MRHAYLYPCLFTFCLTGCGGEDSLAIPGARPGLGSYAGVAIHVSPACYSQDQTPPPDASDADLMEFYFARQTLDFRMSYAISKATLLTKPVRENPTASAWSVHTTRGYVEGSVLARGQDW